MDKLARMKELVNTLNEWARLYYEEDAPVVSDAEYDRLYDELRTLEAEEGYSLKNSPTHRVGVHRKANSSNRSIFCACTVSTNASQKKSFRTGATALSRRSGIFRRSLASINSTVLHSTFCTTTANLFKPQRAETAR